MGSGRFDESASGIPDSQLADFYERVREAVAAVPGVTSVAYSDQSHVGAGFGTGYGITIPGHDYQIVGVCGNVRLYDIRNEIQPIMYLSYRQQPGGEAWFEVRGDMPLSALGSAVSQAVAGVAASLAVTGLTTQRELADRLVATERMFAALGGGLALLAVVLSCVGIYGLMAYSVARRTREIGLRLALGSRSLDVARGVVREAVWLAGAGAVAGVAALVGVRVIRSYLYGVAPHDPSSLIAAVALLGATAVIAAWLPARRAARVEPMRALRCE